MTAIRKKYGLLIIGIALGITYGLTARLLFDEWISLSTVTYLFVIPAALGIIPLVFADDEKLRAYRNVIFVPWLTILGSLIAMRLLELEGILCLLVLGLPFIALGTLGAFLYRIYRIHMKRKKGRVYVLVLLPFVLGSAETLVTTPSEVYSVRNEVFISASPELIWENIVEVDSIDDREYHPGLFNRAGIPRPISARVNRKEVGGTRVGYFGGGLQFVETIVEYEPERKIRFDITLRPESVRDVVFDQHVLNGSYFRFVDVAYELEESPSGEVRLCLTSRYRLTSTVNYYGRIWGDAILADFQERLLRVIELRCESKTRRTAFTSTR